MPLVQFCFSLFSQIHGQIFHVYQCKIELLGLETVEAFVCFHFTVIRLPFSQFSVIFLMKIIVICVSVLFVLSVFSRVISMIAKPY